MGSEHFEEGEGRTGGRSGPGEGQDWQQQHMPNPSPQPQAFSLSCPTAPWGTSQVVVMTQEVGGNGAGGVGRGRETGGGQRGGMRKRQGYAILAVPKPNTKLQPQFDVHRECTDCSEVGFTCQVP